MSGVDDQTSGVGRISGDGAQGSAASSGPGSAMGKPCENCQSACGVDDIFCERCGYDFITGSMPAATSPPPGAADTMGLTSSPSGGPPSSPTSVPSVLDADGRLADGSGRVLIDIALDRDYFASVVTEGEVALPSLVPTDQRLELHGTELHIGRTSASRGIHPTVDVEALTGDPAVSSQHAVLRIGADGSASIVDVGSTNGTFVGSYSGDPITQGVAVDLPPGLPVYLGAWTRLALVAD